MHPWRRAVSAALLVGLGLAAKAADLTSYSFSQSNLPQIYDWDVDYFGQPYRLRAKVDGWYHAANGWWNNWQQLEGMPGTGSHWIDLYWLKYDWDYSTLQEIGPFNGTSIWVESPNSAPSISWSSAPSEANSGQSYFIEAHGSDPNGNLSAVSVWREWTPYAFAGGGNGWDGWSGNPSTDSG